MYSGFFPVHTCRRRVRAFYFRVVSKSSEVKSSEWKSKWSLMRYSNLCLHRGVSVILSYKAAGPIIVQTYIRVQWLVFSPFLKILHITPMMLIMIHLGKENSVCVTCKEKVEGKNIWSKSSQEAVEIIGAGHGLWCHVVLLLSLAGCDTKTRRQAGR